MVLLFRRPSVGDLIQTFRALIKLLSDLCQTPARAAVADGFSDAPRFLRAFADQGLRDSVRVKRQVRDGVGDVLCEGARVRHETPPRVAPPASRYTVVPCRIPRRESRNLPEWSGLQPGTNPPRPP